MLLLVDLCNISWNYPISRLRMSGKIPALNFTHHASKSCEHGLEIESDRVILLYMIQSCLPTCYEFNTELHMVGSGICVMLECTQKSFRYGHLRYSGNAILTLYTYILKLSVLYIFSEYFVFWNCILSRQGWVIQRKLWKLVFFQKSLFFHKILNYEKYLTALRIKCLKIIHL